MNILERLDTLEERIEYYNKLISRIDNTRNEPFKYSRMKTTVENKEIADLKNIIGIPQIETNTLASVDTNDTPL